MSFQPRLYDEMWWVTKIEGSLEIRLFSVGQNKVKCEEECDALQALYESCDPSATLCDVLIDLDDSSGSLSAAFLDYYRGGKDV
jgi:hypothetical protein